MNPAVRECARQLLERLAALPIADVLSKDTNGARVNPFKEAAYVISEFRQLEDIKAWVDDFLSRPPPDDCNDCELFQNICAALQKKFNAEYSFLVLLDESRLQDALFQIERGLFPDIEPNHLAAVRAKREFGAPACPPRMPVPPFEEPPVDQPSPELRQSIIDALRAG
jgi:hypothetical protein